MKKSQLIKIIREEVENVLREVDMPPYRSYPEVQEDIEFMQIIKNALVLHLQSLKKPTDDAMIKRAAANFQSGMSPQKIKDKLEQLIVGPGQGVGYDRLMDAHPREIGFAIESIAHGVGGRPVPERGVPLDIYPNHKVPDMFKEEKKVIYRETLQ